MEYYYEYLKEGFVVGFVVSVTFVTATFMSYYFFIWFHFRTLKKKQYKTPSEARPLVHRFPSHQILDFEQWGVSRMSWDEIKIATNDFSSGNLIGEGRAGPMFRAALANGVSVAVKRLSRVDSEKRLIAEIKSLGKLRHKNLVPLLGLCIEKNDSEREDTVLLVYKHMANGNLRNWLHRKQEEDAMQWSLRLKIGAGVARALAWVHHRSTPRLAHLNITSTHVLLDRDFVPNLSNFGEAVFADDRNSPESSSERWDLDYLKRDVYSFGTLLLEIMALKEEQAQIISSSVADQAHRYRNDVLMALRVALSCLNPAPGLRPNMVQVYKSLREIESAD